MPSKEEVQAAWGAAKYPAHVLMGTVPHYEYVTREMALDAEDPRMEGEQLDMGEEDVWEDRDVVLAEDYDILATYCRELVEAGNAALLGIGAPKTVHIGWACKRYEVTYQANLTNPIEHLRDVLARAPKEETHD